MHTIKLGVLYMCRREEGGGGYWKGECVYGWSVEGAGKKCLCQECSNQMERELPFTASSYCLLLCLLQLVTNSLEPTLTIYLVGPPYV